MRFIVASLMVVGTVACDLNEGPAEDVGEIEWEYFDVISEGNCCHAPCNEICVSKVRS